MASGGWGLLAVVVLLLLWSMVIYRRLLRRQKAVEEAFTEIDQLLQRRYTLIAQWVDVVRQLLPQEAAALELLARARSHALGAAATARRHPGQPGAMGALAMAEGALGSQLAQVREMAARHASLQANAQAGKLMAAITQGEVALRQARAAYNIEVKVYNWQAARLPDLWLARLLGFAPLDMLAATEQAHEWVAPQLRF